MKHSALFIFVLALAASASAQTIVTHELRYYNPGAQSPFQVQALAAAAFTCGQDKVVGSHVNPTRIAFDDPADADLDCVYTAQPGDPILALPVAGYEATMVNIDDAGLRSPESNRAPFELRQPPAAATGLKFVR